jgi:deoxyribonuclease V
MRSSSLLTSFRTRPNTNPLFVSIGYKIDLPTAVEAVLRCVRSYRLPETTRAADHLANSLARGQAP